MTAPVIPDAIGTGRAPTAVPSPTRSAIETARDPHTDTVNGLSGS